MLLGSVTDVLAPSAVVTPTVVAKVRYLPWAETWTAMTDTVPITQTNFHFTGQREEADIGLYDYKARWLALAEPMLSDSFGIANDAQLGRFVQPDPIVPDPGDPQSLNRYTYAKNNPVRFTDPSGYFSEDQIEAYVKNTYGDLWKQYWNAWSSDSVFWEMLRAAEYGDAVFSVTENFGAGTFHQDRSTFSFSSAHGGLEQYQGYGLYMLLYGSGQNRLANVDTQVTVHPVGSGAFQSWKQPIYIYGQQGPSFYGYRLVSYRYSGWDFFWGRDDLPVEASIGIEAFKLGVKKWGRVPKKVAKKTTKFVTAAEIGMWVWTGATLANNGTELYYKLQVDYSDERTFISNNSYGPWPTQP
jgi:hypothetical protein